MGFTVYYRSTEPVHEELGQQIRLAMTAANEGRTWLSCEPAHLFLDQDDGHLLGGSKPNFTPHPDDVASAAAENLPDGTISDVLDILCEISEEFGVDWELSHDHDAGPIGWVRDGVADRNLVGQLEALGELGTIMRGMEAGFDGAVGDGGPEFDEPGAEDDEGDDDDEGPQIFKMWPRP